MNPEYIVLAGWWWRLMGKKVVLWYAHRSVNFKLRFAVFFATKVASSAASSFRLPTKKLCVLGHGVDTEYLHPMSDSRPLHVPIRLISVGRITPIKNLSTVIEAFALCIKRGVNSHLLLVGAAGNETDRSYEKKLRERISILGLEEQVTFRGSVPYKRIAAEYQSSDISINLAPTGGLDKAVMEGMACGVPTLVSNKGFSSLLQAEQERLMYNQDDPADLADKIVRLSRADNLSALQHWVRAQVVEHAGLDSLITKLVGLLS